MKKILSIILFLAIFLLGVILRFYSLGAIPNSLDWDEVSWGYNAYSILQTGKDEYGSTYPLSFKAFGDYKQPVYVYAEVLPIKAFGLTPFAVRFPSAFFGSLSLIFVFLLVRELFAKRPHRKIISFLSMLFFAISPWSIQFSRVAFESTVGLFFVLLGTWLFLLAIRKEKIWQFILAAFFLALSAYSYHSQKLFTPLLAVGLIVYAKTFFLKNKKVFILFVVAFFLFNSLWLIDSRTTARGQSVLFTSQQTEILKHSLLEQQQDKAILPILSSLHNRRIIFGEKFIENYLAHFDFNWLFIQGDLARHHAPDFGLLYLFSFPFIVGGLYFLFTQEKRQAWLLAYWFMLAPIAGSLVIGAPNAERALILLPMWQIFEAFGWLQLARLVRKKKVFMGIAGAVSILYFFNFSLYVHQYFLHTNTDYDRYWQYGYQQAVNFARQPENSGKNIYFSSTIEQAYMFYLFYGHISPKEYLSQEGSNRISNACYQIENAHFGQCTPISGSIFITSQQQPMKSSYNLVKQIPFFAGDSSVYIYTVE